MRKCSKCGIEKEVTDFYSASKSEYRIENLRRMCKECDRKRNLAWRRKNKSRVNQWSKENKEIIAVNTQYREAIRIGKIRKRNSCEICHDSPTQGHHEDYSKPLEVIELCQRCHAKLHHQYREQGIKLK